MRLVQQERGGRLETPGIPSYANQYIGSGEQWLDAANILKTASPEAFGQMAAQYQQAQNPLGTELGKMLLHAGLIPQNANAMRMSMDALSFQRNNLISTLEQKGRKSIEVGNAIQYQKQQYGIDGMEPELRALDTGRTNNLNEDQLRRVIDLRVAMGQLTPEEGAIAQQDVYNTLGKVTFTALEAISLIGLKRSLTPKTLPTKGNFTGNWENLTSAERKFIEKELTAGKNIEAIPTDTTRTADFIIDGVRTELKTISGVQDITSDGISKAIANRVMNGRGQASNIVIDMTEQPGVTVEIAKRGVNRAYGADNRLGKTIQNIRIIGQNFDINITRRGN